MRSELVFQALVQVSNRYQLCQLATKATHKFHKPNARVQGTISDVLDRFHSVNPNAEAHGDSRAPRAAKKRRAA